jgi:ubiquinone/menaquinone biosynthesis C-methylase UbiE
MGWYREQVLPRLTERLMRAPDMNELRASATAGLAGAVVEIGFGSGLNVRYYPPEVERVWAVEPSAVARRIAGDRIADSPVPVELVGLDGQRLPLDDASADGALSTWTLCTIPDVDRALAELRRVLRPDGRFHFVEHGLHPEAAVQRWQHRLEPVQKRWAGGCHLTRSAEELVAGAGFDLVEVAHETVSGLKVSGYCTIGVAVNPG